MGAWEYAVQALHVVKELFLLARVRQSLGESGKLPIRPVEDGMNPVIVGNVGLSVCHHGYVQVVDLAMVYVALDLAQHVVVAYYDGPDVVERILDKRVVVQLHAMLPYDGGTVERARHGESWILEAEVLWSDTK